MAPSTFLAHTYVQNLRPFHHAYNLKFSGFRSRARGFAGNPGCRTNAVVFARRKDRAIQVFSSRDVSAHAAVVMSASLDIGPAGVGAGILTSQQQMAVTQVVVSQVPLPLPQTIKEQVVGQIVASISVSVAQQLSPKLRSALREGRALTDKELDQLVNSVLTRVPVPLLGTDAAKPVIRAVLETLFASNLRLENMQVQVDWKNVLAAGVGLEEPEYRQKLAVDLAAAVDIPGVSEAQEVKIAEWVLENTVTLAQKLLPAQILPVLRASSTKDLDALRPKLADAMVASMEKAPLGVAVVVPTSTKHKLADMVVDWLYANYIEDSSMRVRLMTRSERAVYDRSALHKRYQVLEQTQADLRLQTQLAASQRWHNHWEMVKILYQLRLMQILVLARWTLIGTAVATVLAAGFAGTCALTGNWQYMDTVVKVWVPVGVAYVQAALTPFQTLVAFCMNPSWHRFLEPFMAFTGGIFLKMSHMMGLI